jgi:hypothetical protein
MKMTMFKKTSGSVLIGQALVLAAVLAGCGPAGDTTDDAGRTTASPDAGTAPQPADGGATEGGVDNVARSSSPAESPLALSLTCASGAQCASGFCVDGVCCDSACDGSCRSCAMTGKVGTCSPVITAPDDTCNGDSTCDSDGNCRKDLGKACSGPSDCASGSCVDGMCCSSSACGTCQSCAVPGALGVCAPVPKFTDDKDSCPPETSTCNGLGACQLKNGQPSTTGSACASQQSADGVCCDSACTSTCYSCNQPGQAGSCKPIDGAQDQSADVTCEGTSICVAPGGATPACKLKDGESCTTSDQCANGSCLTSYADLDHDGWGGNSVRRCETAPQAGYVLKSGDCCDLDASAHPGVTTYTQGDDFCGSADRNCDGVVECEAVTCTGGKFGSICPPKSCR